MNAYIRDNYKSNEENFIQKYLNLVKQILMTKRGNVELICIYDLLNAELEILTKQCMDLLESFSLALKDVSEYTRVLVAKSIGILWASGSSFDDFNKYVSEYEVSFALALNKCTLSFRSKKYCCHCRIDKSNIVTVAF